MSKTGVDNLSNRIIKELKTYADTTSEKVKEAVKNVSKTVKEDIENTAPKHTGKYAKSWAVKTVKETENALTLVVHSKNKYQLTHLLESTVTLNEAADALRQEHTLSLQKKKQLKVSKKK